MCKIRCKKRGINIIALSLIMVILGNFLNYNSVLAENTGNNKDTLYNKKDSTWTKVKRYLLTGTAVIEGCLLIKRLIAINKDKNNINEEFDLNLPNVYVLGNGSKKPIVEALGLIDEKVEFEEKSMKSFKMTGKYDGIDKKVNVFSMPNGENMEFTSRSMLGLMNALNIVSVDLDKNISEIRREINNWKNIIFNTDKSRKRTIFVCVYNGHNIDENKMDIIKDIVNSHEFALELRVLIPSIFLISRDKNAEEGKNLKDNILRLA